MPFTLFAAALAAAPVAVTAPPPNPAFGLWANPKGTLAVRTGRCADAPRDDTLCGAIVRAAPQAQADAREAGVERLVGTELLQNYHSTGHGSWAGRVFVPDMGRSFSSRIRQSAPDELTVSGCLFAGYFCRSQQWHRLP